jgi:hypothetical protein
MPQDPPRLECVSHAAPPRGRLTTGDVIVIVVIFTVSGLLALNGLAPVRILAGTGLITTSVISLTGSRAAGARAYRALQYALSR